MLINWQQVDGGRARTLRFADAEAACVRVSDDGTVHVFTGVDTVDALAAASPAGDLAAFIDRLTALDTIDIVSRSLGGDDPGPVADE